MSNVNVTIRMDENLKKQADTLFGELGLNLSTAFNIFVRQAVREQSIPFIIANRQPNAETLAAIEEVQKMKADPSLGKSYTDVSQMMEDLLA
ncbi:MAG: type II toxin-antitoxin system RelB/DinJ family antitoxin [Clostridia bacterium]|nr:type II toxin-antitoxin system RelB/DinJ family antitoxin [Oscillospiraceae bacterium]MBQ3519971.1 type II toxin-antitoxin system RelB/DinJ family antitoxin [Clostridia bacterium]MBR3955501.1 type II toxin-antitoxin system RelB/DinJ family antitoxin [Clostridia bacterium]